MKTTPGIIYTGDLKKEIDKRYARYKSGKVKAVCAEESKKRIRKLIHPKSKT